MLSYNKLLKRVSSTKLIKKRINKITFLFEGLLTFSQLINTNYIFTSCIKSSLLSGKKIKFLIKNLKLIDSSLDYKLISIENNKSQLIHFLNYIKKYSKLPTIIYVFNTVIITKSIKKIINVGWYNKKSDILIVNKPIKKLNLIIHFYRNYLIFILSKRKVND